MVSPQSETLLTTFHSGVDFQDRQFADPVGSRNCFRADHKLKWDGTKREISSWNRDHTLRTAVARSVVWYFERMASQAPTDRIAAYLENCAYGNAKPTGGKPFWINGDLRISPDQQIEFLRKLRADRLPCQKKHQQTVRKLIRLDDDGLHGKTGWARPDGTNLGWFVGWLDADDATYFFALNIESKSSRGFGAARKEIVERALQIIRAQSK